MKWIKDLNIRPKTIKCIEENIGMKLKDLGFKEDYMNLASKAKINEWDYVKLKTVCSAKATVNKVKVKPSEWGNIFASKASEWA